MEVKREKFPSWAGRPEMEVDGRDELEHDVPIVSALLLAIH